MDQRDIPRELIEPLLAVLKKWGRGNLGHGMVRWNEKLGRVQEYLFLEIWVNTPEEVVLRAFQQLESLLVKESHKQSQSDKYGDALTYFYGDKARISDEGKLFIYHGFMNQKYLTPAELDEILERYNKLLKKKMK